jgi:hypothetical protein
MFSTVYGEAGGGEGYDGEFVYLETSVILAYVTYFLPVEKD